MGITEAECERLRATVASWRSVVGRSQGREPSDRDLAKGIGQLIADGVVESRSDAVRKGLQALIEQTRRPRTADEIIAGYTDHPQTEDEVAWADRATVQMIADEPW